MPGSALFTDDFDMPTTTMAAENIDFATGETVKVITIPIAEDNLIEDCETFDLVLTLRDATDAADNVLLLPLRDTSHVYILDRTGNPIRF